jgi:glycine betaine/proline transport system permease protein
VDDYKLPLGSWIEQFIDFVNRHAAGPLDAFSAFAGNTIDGFIGALKWCPPLFFIAAAVVGVLVLRRAGKLALFVGFALLLILNLGYWEATMETLALVLCATVVCVVVGVPLGIASAHRPWLYQIVRPVLDLMQTIPPFVYLIPTLIFFGLGIVPGIISTTVFAIPAPIRLTYLGISGVPPALVEAGTAFGATRGQLLRKIELPYAMPSILAGVTQCIMLSLSMVVIAALVGADGLGKPVVRALNTVNVAQGFEAGLAIVLLAVVLDRVCKPDESAMRQRNN